MTPECGNVKRRPAVVVTRMQIGQKNGRTLFDFCRAVLEQELDYSIVAIGTCDMKKSSSVHVLGVQVELVVTGHRLTKTDQKLINGRLATAATTAGRAAAVQYATDLLGADLFQVVEHLELGLTPLQIYGLLGDATRRHFRLDVFEAKLVVADIVGHVAVRIDGEQIGVALDQHLADLEVGAGGGRMQWRPQVVVDHVHVRAESNQEQKQVGAVVYAALQGRRIYKNSGCFECFRLFLKQIIFQGEIVSCIAKNVDVVENIFFRKVDLVS